MREKFPGSSDVSWTMVGFATVWTPKIVEFYVVALFSDNSQAKSGRHTLLGGGWCLRNVHDLCAAT